MEKINISNEYAPRINFSAAGFQKYLEFLIFAGIVLIALFPLIGDYGNLLFPLGRDILFRIIVEIIFSLYLLLIILDRSRLPRPSLILLFLSLFLFISGLAAIFSVQPQFSFWGNIFRGHGFFSQIHYLLFFIVLSAFLKTWKKWEKIILTAIVASIPVSLISVFEFFNTGVDAQSTLNNPNFLGAYLLLVVFLTAAFLFSQGNRKHRIYLEIILALQVFAVYLTGSRGAYLGLIAGAAVFLFFIVKRRIFASRKNILISIAILAMLATGAFYYLTNNYLSPAKSFFQDSKTVQKPIFWIDWMRLEYFRAAMEGVKEKPTLGWGQENFTVVYDKYYRGTFDGQYEWSQLWADKVHNVFLETGVTTGLLGLAAYLCVWISAFWLLLKRDANIRRHTNDTNNLLKIGLLATFAAYLTQNLFNIDTTTSLIYATLWLALLNFLTASPSQILASKIWANKQIDPHTQSKNLGAIQRTIFIASIILLFPFLIFVIKNYNIRPLATNLKFNQAEAKLREQKFETGFQRYEEGLKINDPAVSPHIRYRYGVVAISLAKQRKNLSIEQNFKELERALELQEENAKKEWPYFTRNWVIDGVLSNFMLEGEKSEYKKIADGYFKKALELSPNRATTWIEWAKTDLLAKDNEKAEEKLRIAGDINQNFLGKTTADLTNDPLGR